MKDVSAFNMRLQYLYNENQTFKYSNKIIRNQVSIDNRNLVDLRQIYNKVFKLNDFNNVDSRFVLQSFCFI